MPRRKTTIKLITRLPFGKDGEYTLYVKDTSGNWINYTDYVNKIDAVIELNNQADVSIELIDIDTSERDVIRENAEYMIFLGENKLLVKGIFLKVEFASDGVVGIKATDMSAKLNNYEVVSLASATGNPKRQIYEDTSFRTIIKELASEDGDGISPWIIETGDSHIDEYGTLTVRFENLSRLESIARTCDAIKYDWYIHTEYPYSDDYLKCELHRGSTTSVFTFNATNGASSNCLLTSRERDISNMINDVTVLGRGDGDSQIKASIYAGSSTYSKLAAKITATDTTIPLQDASSFPSSGEIIIGEERITYTGKSGNNLTGCTRGANSTTATEHYKNVLVFVYYPKTSPESSSSIGTYGLKSKTIYNPDIISRSHAELVASKYLEERLEPIESVVVKPYEVYDTFGTMNLGDVVTIIDDDAGTSNDYRLVRIHYIFDEGAEEISYELGNKKSRYVAEIKSDLTRSKETGTFMQGSTFMYMTGETDNCDSSHGISIDFYIPEDAVDIQKILLMYKASAPRVWASVTSSSGSHKHSVKMDSHTHSVTIPDHTHDVTISSSGAHTHQIGTLSLDWSDYVGTTTHVGDTSDTGEHTHGTFTSSSGGGTTVTSAAGDGTYETSTYSGSHSHSVSYAISEKTQTSTSYTIIVDGNTVGTYSDDTKENINVKDYLSEPIAGSWHTIEIKPNGNCRIKADIFIKGFTEAR